MEVRVVTNLEALNDSLQEHLQSQGYEVETQERSVRSPEIVVGPDVDTEVIVTLLSHIQPFQPKITMSEDLDVQAEIRLGDNRPLSSWDLHMYSSSEEISSEVSDPLHDMGFSNEGHTDETLESNSLVYGGASAFARHLVRWIAGLHGFHNIEEKKSWGDSDNDIYLKLSQPSEVDANGLPELTLAGDDLAAMFALQKRITAATGHDNLAVVHLTDNNETFAFHTGAYARSGSAAEDIAQVVQEYLVEQDVSPESHPLEQKEEGPAFLYIPIQRWRNGDMKRYAGDHPDRWEFIIHTDAEDEVAPFVETLEGMGYSVSIEERDSNIFEIQYATGAISDYEDTSQAIRDALEAFVGTLGLNAPDAHISDEDIDTPNEIRIHLPLELLRSGVDGRLMAMAESWNCRLKTPGSTGYDDLYQTLTEYPFSSFERSDESSSTYEIKFGGAPRALMNHLVRVIEEHTQIRVTLNKAWGDDDHDVWIYLPTPGTGAGTSEVEVDALDTSIWFNSQGVVASGDLVEVSEDTVRIGHVTLPRVKDGDRKLIPPSSQFEHYCLDQRTAESLIHIAEGVQLREPVLLEGETSVSKTSVIQMLAMLLGQPLVRLNLNGQTDTGELVGRFLPQNMVGDLPLDVDELRDAKALLESESRLILDQAHSEDRQLSSVEIQQIMANEGMSSHPWRWADGLVVSAMKHGWWLVLDELNLAEPQILERLNSVLERTPTLVLTEYDNTVYGGSGLPVHPNFRVFATMNPAEYSGRSVLSPAYRDRWRGYRYVPAPSEDDYHTMLRFLVDGQQPDISMRGRGYTGNLQPAAYAALADVPGIYDFLESLARFHSALEATSRNPDKQRQANLGTRRRERYIFTRRGLLAVMDLLTNAIATGIEPTEAMRVSLLRYYLGRIANPADQHTVARLMDAAGIGLNTWTVGQERTEEDGE